MSKSSKTQVKTDSGVVEVKSKFDAEFRRFSVSRHEAGKYEDFKQLVERLHHLADVPFLISYTDPRDGDLLPINNDDNLGRALLTARPLLRVIVQRKAQQEDCLFHQFHHTEGSPPPILPLKFYLRIAVSRVLFLHKHDCSALRQQLRLLIKR
ncbi:hypothetical protein L9F63_022944, partial [Diploptera punctata]